MFNTTIKIFYRFHITKVNKIFYIKKSFLLVYTIYFNYLCNIKELKIYKYQAKQIENTLRLVARILESKNKICNRKSNQIKCQTN